MSRPISSHSLTAVVAAIALAIPMTAVAQNVSTHEQHASASFFVDSPSGCLILNVGASQVIQKRPKPQTIQSFLSLELNREFEGRDCATIIAAGGWSQVVIASGVSDEAPSDFTVDQRLMHASLKATIPATFLETGADVSFLVDLTWTGIVDQLSPERFHQTFPGALPGPVVVHTRGYSRPATANGSVSDGSTDYAQNPVSTNAISCCALSIRTQQTAGPKPRLLH